MKNKYSTLYNEKKLSLEQILDHIQSRDLIIPGGACGEPVDLLKNIHRIAKNVEGVEVIKSIDLAEYPFMQMPEIHNNISVTSTFLGPAGRTAYEKKNAEYLPTPLSSWGETLKSIARSSGRRTVFSCAVSGMDEHGFLCSGTSLQWEKAAIEAADIVIFEVNENIPRVYGDAFFHISEADFIYESSRPLSIVEPIIPTDVEQRIGENIASLIDDGSCIQLGIGGIPDAAANALKDKKNLGVHSELITSTMVDLYEMGVITGANKKIDKNIMVGAFAMGNEKLYKFIKENPAVNLRAGAYVNDPFVISQNDQVVSVNAALQVDLTGQICSESIGARQYSGIGGALDFAYGAKRSKGGKGIMALRSTAKKGTISAIQPILTPGAQVSIPRIYTDYVITEYGIAHVSNCTVKERAERLIAISHPDFRDELRHEAEKLNLL